MLRWRRNIVQKSHCTKIVLSNTIIHDARRPVQESHCTESVLSKTIIHNAHCKRVTVQSGGVCPTQIFMTPSAKQSLHRVEVCCPKQLFMKPSAKESCIKSVPSVTFYCDVEKMLILHHPGPPVILGYSPNTPSSCHKLER